MSKFTRKPKAAPGVEAFIAGAERRPAPSDDAISSDIQPSETTSSEITSSDSSSYSSMSSSIESYDTMPWNAPKVRDDMLKVYNLRLPEPYFLKLKFIAEHTPGSMHKFCLDALLPAIDAEIERLAKG